MQTVEQIESLVRSLGSDDKRPSITLTNSIMKRPTYMV